MKRVPFLVCTSAFYVGNDFDTRRTTSAYIAIPTVKPDGTTTWEPAGLGNEAFVPRRALATWVGLMRGTDPNSPRDKGFVRHMEEYLDEVIEA